MIDPTCHNLSNVSNEHSPHPLSNDSIIYENMEEYENDDDDLEQSLAAITRSHFKNIRKRPNKSVLHNDLLPTYKGPFTDETQFNKTNAFCKTIKKLINPK